MTEVLTAFIMRAKTQPDLADALRRRYGGWVRGSQEMFRGLDAQGVLRKGLDLDSAAVEFLALSRGLAELDLMDADIFTGVNAERLIDGYLSRVGPPAQLKRLGIAPW